MCYSGGWGDCWLPRYSVEYIQEIFPARHLAGVVKYRDVPRLKFGKRDIGKAGLSQSHVTTLNFYEHFVNISTLYFQPRLVAF